MEEFGVGQSVTDFVADLVVIRLYPKFLEGDDIVVRPRERVGDSRYALTAVLGDILQAPGNKLSEGGEEKVMVVQTSS